MLTYLFRSCYNLVTDLIYQYLWGISSAGRAPRLHRGGQRFDPAMLHQIDTKLELSIYMGIRVLICLKL